MNLPQVGGEKLSAVAASTASVVSNLSHSESANPQGVYTFKCVGPVESRRAEYCNLRDNLAELEAHGLGESMVADLLRSDIASIPMEDKWTDVVHNLVTTAGKNDMLDKYLAGSSYTAAFYLGVISSTSYTAVAVGDTMSSHSGWLEAGTANDPHYSQSTRPTTAWSSAASGSKALSSNLTYSITTTGTLKGAFLTTVSTKDGTTGTLFSAGLFSGGDKAVSNGDTVSVSYSLSL